MAAATAEVPTKYKKVGTDKVGKWGCDKYEGTRPNGEKVSEVCTVTPVTLGFTAADFEVSRQMAEFFSKLIHGEDEMFRLGAANTPTGFSGIPARTISFRNGTQNTVSEITDVSRQKFPDSAFAVPAGYQKRDMMGGRGRGRQ